MGLLEYICISVERILTAEWMYMYLHAHDKIVVQCIETVQSLVLLLKYPDACLYKFLKILFMVSLI